MPYLEPDLAALAKFTVFFPFAAGVIGIIWLLLPVWRSPRYGRGLDYITLVASFLSLVTSVMMAFYPPNQVISLLWTVPVVGEIGFLIDAMSLYFILLVNVIAFVASWSAVGYREGILTGSRRQSPAFFHTLVNFFHVTMLLVPLVDNLIALWIAIESTTLVSTLLVSFQDKKDSWEAAWKYLIITSTGIIFALIGTMFLANAAKGLIPTIAGDHNRVMNWTFLLQHAKDLSPDFVKLSFLFILVGYGTKAGLAPMHTWLPDGHGEAPAPISALLSGVLLKSALYAILRFYTITNAVLNDAQFTSKILLGSGLFSLMLATPFILKENRFKRVLAYHSLEHIRAHFLGVSARLMRQILVDHARRQQAKKRGGVAFQPLPIDEARDAAPADRLVDVLVLNDALERLAAVDLRSARVVELRIFGGLTAEEAASVLGVSKRTVDTDWSAARLWLAKQLGPASPPDPV